MSTPNWPGGGSQFPEQQPSQPGWQPSQPTWQHSAPPEPQNPAPSPWGQPAPSQPLYPPTQAGMSEPTNPSGFPPAQPYYGAPPSQPLYGQPGPFGGQMEQPRRKRSLKGLWIGLAIVLLLLVLAGGGVVFAVAQLAAPATAAVTFCNDLKTQNYTTAYQLLSTNLKGQFTQTQFSAGAQALDSVEGPVTSCKQAAGSKVYSYSFGANTATLVAVITRSKQGDLSGTIHLKSENGNWRVDALDTSLLGANLASLQTVQTFCTAMASKDYTTAYNALGSVAHTQLTAAQFQAQAQLHDEIDGAVTGCTLASFGSGNDDSITHLVVSVNRAKLGARTGDVALDVEGGAWKVATVDVALLGTDLGPLLVGEQFCNALQAAKYDDALALMSTGFKADAKASDLALPSGLKWGGCTPNLTTYKVSSSSASFTADLKVIDTSTNRSVDLSTTLKFVLEGTNWKIDDLITNP